MGWLSTGVPVRPTTEPHWCAKRVAMAARWRGPGLGSLMVDAIHQRDYPVVQGVVLVIALGYVLANRAADLLAGPWRDRLNAATMLNQSKTVFQAEIDSACELIDFFNFNTQYMEAIYADQPPISVPGTWNTLEQRPLEGVVLAAVPLFRDLLL